MVEETVWTQNQHRRILQVELCKNIFNRLFFTSFSPSVAGQRILAEQ